MNKSSCVHGVVFFLLVDFFRLLLLVSPFQPLPKTDPLMPNAKRQPTAIGFGAASESRLQIHLACFPLDSKACALVFPCSTTDGYQFYKVRSVYRLASPLKAVDVVSLVSGFSFLGVIGDSLLVGRIFSFLLFPSILSPRNPIVQLPLLPPQSNVRNCLLA